MAIDHMADCATLWVIMQNLVVNCIAFLRTGGKCAVLREGVIL